MKKISQLLILAVVLFVCLSCASEGTPYFVDKDDDDDDDSGEEDGDLEDSLEQGESSGEDGDADIHDSVDGDKDNVADGDLDKDSIIEEDVDYDHIPGDSITIGTFNVRRYFDTICDSGQCGSNDYEVQLTSSEFDARAEQIANAINDMDVDIILLQEIEKAQCVATIRSYLDENYPIYVIGETNYDASLDVAIIAKGERLQTISHWGEVLHKPNGEVVYFARDFLEVQLNVNGHKVIVFSAHFKSKANDDPDRRWAEAAGAYKIVTERASKSPEALIVFGGDLNDTPGSDPIDEIEKNNKLLRVASELSDYDAATYYWSGNYQAIDHLFIANDASGEYISGTTESVRGQNGFGLGGSDHAALKATFELPE